MKFIPSWSSKWQKIERAKKIYEIWEYEERDIYVNTSE